MKHIILAVALCATSAHAEFQDGNKLLADMNGSQMRQMSALGYVMGVSDAINGVSACLPSAVTVGQVHDMVKNHLDANPQTRHFTADVIVNHVLSRAWPCQRRGSGT